MKSPIVYDDNEIKETAEEEERIAKKRNHAIPIEQLIADEKGNVFLIKNLNQKQTERMLELYKKRMIISIKKLRLLHHRLYDIQTVKLPRLSEASRIHIDKKISKEAGFVLNQDLQAFHKKMKETEKEYAEVVRHKTFVNMAIIQLENGADPKMILNLLKQTQMEEPE